MIIQGASPERMTRAAWLALGLERAARMEENLRREPEASALDLIWLRWQVARFMQRWGADQDRQAAWRDLRGVIDAVRRRNPPLVEALPAALVDSLNR